MPSHVSAPAAVHDDNVLLEDVIPEFHRRRPTRYAGVRLRDLCGDMHRFFRDAGVSEFIAKLAHEKKQSTGEFEKEFFKHMRPTSLTRYAAKRW